MAAQVDVVKVNAAHKALNLHVPKQLISLMWHDTLVFKVGKKPSLKLAANRLAGLFH